MSECDEAKIEEGERVNNGQTAVTGECTSFCDADCSTELENRSRVLIISNEEVRKNFVFVVEKISFSSFKIYGQVKCVHICCMTSRSMQIQKVIGQMFWLLHQDSYQISEGHGLHKWIQGISKAS